MKYFEGILEKFTMKQRLIVLIFLLIFSFLFMFGNDIITTFDKRGENLVEVIDSQEAELKKLRIELRDSHLEIIENQRECTRRAVEREKEIFEELDFLERRISSTRNRSRAMTIVQLDTVSSDSSIILSSPRIVEVDNTEMIIGELKKIKSHLKN